jgi:hypothetical protein
MQEVKDTLRATVRVSYDGRVYKTFRGPDAQERFANEVRVLRHLEKEKCNFVPRLLEANAEQLRIVTTNCGVRVEHLDKQRAAELLQNWSSMVCAMRTPRYATLPIARRMGALCHRF